MHRSEFLKELKILFPELTKIINKQEGLLSFEIDEFRKFTNGAVGAKDKATVKLCYKLAEKAYLSGNSSLKALINTEFVEFLDLKHNEWAWEILPEVLKKLYIDFFGLTPKEQLKLKKTFG